MLLLIVIALPVLSRRRFPNVTLALVFILPRLPLALPPIAVKVGRAAFGRAPDPAAV